MFYTSQVLIAGFPNYQQYIFLNQNLSNRVWSLMLKVGENKVVWNKLSNLFGSIKIAFETSRFLHSFKGVIFWLAI